MSAVNTKTKLFHFSTVPIEQVIAAGTMDVTIQLDLLPTPLEIFDSRLARISIENSYLQTTNNEPITISWAIIDSKTIIFHLNTNGAITTRDFWFTWQLWEYDGSVLLGLNL